MVDLNQISLTEEQNKVIDELSKDLDKNEGVKYFVIKKSRGVGATVMMAKYITKMLKYRIPFDVLLISKDRDIFDSIVNSLDKNNVRRVTSKCRVLLENKNTLIWKREWNARYENKDVAFDLIFDDNEQDRPEDFYKHSDFLPLLATNGRVVVTDGIDSKNTYDNMPRIISLEMKKKIKVKSKPIEIKDVEKKPDEKEVKETKDPFGLDLDSMGVLIDNFFNEITDEGIISPIVLVDLRNGVSNLKRKLEEYGNALPDEVLEKFNMVIDFCNKWSKSITGYTNLDNMTKRLSKEWKKRGDNVEETWKRIIDAIPDMKEEAKEHMQEIINEHEGKYTEMPLENDEELKERAKDTYEKMKDENKNVSPNWFEERQQQLDKEIEDTKEMLARKETVNGADAKIMEVTNAMYENLIAETRKKLESEKRLDGSRVYSDREVTERISILRKLQKDAVDRETKLCSSPKGLTECLGEDYRFVKNNNFVVHLPLFDDMRDYGHNVEKFFCDYESKTIEISLNEFENDIYFPELIQYWTEILNGEKKMINIRVERINSFGKILYTEDFANCTLEDVHIDTLNTKDYKDTEVYLIYNYSKVVFTEDKTNSNKKCACSIENEGRKAQDQSKMVFSREFARAQELCSEKGQAIIDELSKIDNKKSGNAYSKLKKKFTCDN